MYSTPKYEMKNLKNQKLYVQVYEQIKTYILQNKLSAGDKLPTEIQMCQMLNVSRNVLREAIKALEITGVVSSTPGVGITVLEFSPEHLFENLFYSLSKDGQALLNQTLPVRRVLELGFLKESFDSLEESDIDLLFEQLRIMEKIGNEILSENESTVSFGYEFHEADAAFHKILYSRTQNPILTAIIDAVWSCDKFHKASVIPSHFENTIKKHRLIAQALKDRDFNAYCSAMHYHFNVDYKPYEENSADLWEE